MPGLTNASPNCHSETGFLDQLLGGQVSSTTVERRGVIVPIAPHDHRVDSPRHAGLGTSLLFDSISKAPCCNFQLRCQNPRERQSLRYNEMCPGLPEKCHRSPGSLAMNSGCAACWRPPPVWKEIAVSRETTCPVGLINDAKAQAGRSWIRPDAKVTTAYGRYHRLRDVAGSVTLGTAMLSGSSILSGWA